MVARHDAFMVDAVASSSCMPFEMDTWALVLHCLGRGKALRTEGEKFQHHGPSERAEAATAVLMAKGRDPLSL